MSAPIVISRDRLTGAVIGVLGFLAVVVLIVVLVSQKRAADESRAADAEHEAQLSALVACTHRVVDTIELRETLANAITWRTPDEWSEKWQDIRLRNPLPNC